MKIVDLMNGVIYSSCKTNKKIHERIMRIVYVLKQSIAAV